jgi:hypothetical protein
MITQAHLDAFDRVDRVTEDSGQFKCKLGTPCNGRCIPKGRKCGGLKSAAAVTGGALAAVGALGVAGGAALMGRNKRTRAANAEYFQKAEANRAARALSEQESASAAASAAEKQKDLARAARSGRIGANLQASSQKAEANARERQKVANTKAEKSKQVASLRALQPKRLLGTPKER